MTDDEIKARLLGLATEAQRTLVSRIEALLPEIEAALSAGAKRSQVVELLNEAGIEIDANAFGVYMHRLRARANRLTVPIGPIPAPPVASKAAPTTKANKVASK